MIDLEMRPASSVAVPLLLTAGASPVAVAAAAASPAAGASAVEAAASAADAIAVEAALSPRCSLVPWHRS